MANNLDDITLLPEEIILVNMEQQTMGNQLDVELLSKILDHLICARKKGMKLVSVKSMSQYFNIDLNELDKWLQIHSQVERKITGKGIVCYGLSKIKEIDSLDSPEFTVIITMILSEDDKLWKSLGYISAKINTGNIHFSENAVEERLAKCSGLLRKVGDKDVIYYGLIDRMSHVMSNQQNKNKNKKKKSTKIKQQQPSYDRSILMALSMLHPNCDTLLRVMNFYGNKIAVNHSEAYAFIAKAQKDLSRGVSLLMNDLKISDKQMPDLEKI